MAEGCGDWREPGWRLGSLGRRKRKDRLPSFCLLVPLPRACLSWAARALKRPLGTAVMLVPAGSFWHLCQDGPLLDPAGKVQYLRPRVLVPDGLHLLMGQASSQLSVSRAPVMVLYFASDETAAAAHQPSRHCASCKYARQHGHKWGHKWEHMGGSRKAKKETRCRLGFALMRGCSPGD